MFTNYLRSIIYTNELTYEITNENLTRNCWITKRCEYHDSVVQMSNSLSESDEQSRNAMLKLAENSNTFNSTRVSQLPDTKVNIIIICFVIVICTILFNSSAFRNSWLLVSLLTILYILYGVVIINIFRNICKTINEAMAYTFIDCGIFEKAEQLSPLIHVDDKESTNYPRSRYVQFIYFERVQRRRHKLVDREPSRIPLKQLARAFRKSKKVREAVRNYIRKNVPRSSGIHLFTSKGAFSRSKERYTNCSCKWKPRKRIDEQTSNNRHKRCRNTPTLRFSKTHNSDNSNLCQLHSAEVVYKNLSHRIKYNEFNT